MSELLTQQVVEVVKFTLNAKDGSGTTTYYAGLEYSEADELYSGSPEVFPLLASSPQCIRSVGRHMMNQHETSVNLFAHEPYGNPFITLLDDYELTNSAVEIRAYFKPTDAITTHTDSVNIRQTLTVTGYKWDGDLLTIAAKDTWIKDREITKRLETDDFDDLDSDWDLEYGAIPVGDNVVIDAPFIANEIVSSKPTAKIFSGWCSSYHHVKTLNKVYVKNRDNRKYDTANWLEVELVTDPQSSVKGGTTASPYSSVTMAEYTRAWAYSPATKAQILTHSRGKFVRDGYYNATTFGTTGFLECENSSDFVFGNEDFSFQGWFKCANLTNTTIIASLTIGSMGVTDYEISISNTTGYLIWTISDGSNSQSAMTSGSVGTSWHHTICTFDASAAQLEIYVDGSSVATRTTTITTGDCGGPFRIGASHLYYAAALTLSDIAVWRKEISSAEVTTLYNSGTPLFYEDISDALKVSLVSWWDLRESGANDIRKDLHSRHDLRANGSCSVGNSKKAISSWAQYGHLYFHCSHAEWNTPSATFIPTDTIITVANDSDDSTLSSSYSNLYFQLPNYVICSKDVSYLTTFEWSNHKDIETSMIMGYYVATGTDHYLRDHSDTASSDGGWRVEEDVAIDAEIYALGKGDDDWDDGTTQSTYAYQHLEAKSITVPTGQTRQNIDDTLIFKLDVDGLQDDSSGTYTGSAYALMKNPADLIRFWLLDQDLGAGLATSSVDATSFTSVRTSLGSTFDMSYALDSQTFLVEHLTKICRQARVILYKSREGKLKLHYPNPTKPVEAVVKESLYRDRLSITELLDTPIDAVINDILLPYGRDVLNVPKDPAVLRRTRSDAFASVSEATDSDSITLYDRREYREDFDLYASDSNAPKAVANYWINRYSTKQRRCTFTVPRIEFYAKDFFNTIRVTHGDLVSSAETLDEVTWKSGTTSQTWYNEGVPTTWDREGSLSGEVIAIRETGTEMEITLETF